MLGFSTGHSAFGAGVAVTIVRTSKVGVTVGMVGSGVMVGVAGVRVSGVRVGLGEVEVFLGVRLAEGTSVRVVAGMSAGGAAQAASKRHKSVKMNLKRRMMTSRFFLLF